MSRSEQPGRRHAIVMGGSMAGLLTARVLSDHYATVTIIERDALPTQPDHRRGVPQSKHTHGLLAAGYGVLARLFPGFPEQLAAKGAPIGDIVRDVRWYFEGGTLARPSSGMHALAVSRPFLEAEVRARVRALRNVALREGLQVVGLAIERSHRVAGVRLVSGDTLLADLVVDATGRGSRSPQWLQALGYGAPIEDRVQVALGYTTRIFRRTPSHLAGDTGAVIPPTASGKRGGVMVAQEGDRWTVTLISHFGPQAPEDLAGFIEFAATLPSRDIYDVVRQAEPIGDATLSGFPASQRRRYERLTRFPEGYVVIGDGICSFNPIYGQGMSVAAVEAVELGKVVQVGVDRVGLRFFKKAGAIVDIPWSTAVARDLQMPEAIGPRTKADAIIGRYVAALHRAAHEDPTLALAFLRVSNLMSAPTSILKPTIAARVLWGALRRRFGRRAPTATPARAAEHA